jgi:hypothetical protein
LSWLMDMPRASMPTAKRVQIILGEESMGVGIR